MEQIGQIFATIRRIDRYFDFNEKLDAMVAAGITSFRFNLSKPITDQELVRDIANIRNRFQGKNIQVMLDIPYPGAKARIHLNEIIHARKGQRFLLNNNGKNKQSFLETINVENMADCLSVGMKLLYDGGEGLLEVIDIVKDCGYILEAMGSFDIADGKSIVTSSFMRQVYDFGILKKIQPDYVAFSFVETAQEMLEIRNELNNMDCQLIAKIETIIGVQNVCEILDKCDGIMIARGDLALNVEGKEFLEIQRYLGVEAHRNKKICIIATDILQSLRKSFFPSRAEINDLCLIKEIGADSIVFSLQLSTSSQIDIAVEYVRNILY